MRNLWDPEVFKSSVVGFLALLGISVLVWNIIFWILGW